MAECKCFYSALEFSIPQTIIHYVRSQIVQLFINVNVLLTTMCILLNLMFYDNVGDILELTMFTCYGIDKILAFCILLACIIKRIQQEYMRLYIHTNIFCQYIAYKLLQIQQNKFVDMLHYV